MKKINLILFFSIIFISCSNDIDKKNPISFSKKDYSEAFQLIDYWLNSQKDYENLPGITAVIGDSNGPVWSGAFGMANEKDIMNIEILLTKTYKIILHALIAFIKYPLWLIVFLSYLFFILDIV